MKRPVPIPFLLVPLVSILLFSPGTARSQEEKNVGLAVMRLKATGISETEAETLTETLHSGISRLILERRAGLKERYTLLERSQMDKIFEQFQVQDSGCTDEKCAVEFGKMLAVERIVVGSVGLVGSTYAITGRLVDVGSSKVIRSVSRTYEGKIDNVLFIIPLVGEELLTGYRPPDPPNLAGRIPSPAVPPSSPRTAAAPGASYLTVEGTPPSAAVRIDGQSVGSAPVQFHPLAPGKHAVLVAAAGYEEFAREVVIEPEKRHRLSYTLVPLANLSFKGSPGGATVAVDGKEIGNTPLETVEIPRGSYTVTVSCAGYTEHREKVALSPGETKEIAYTLLALVKASISSMPEGADVFIDGKKAGGTPLRDHPVTEGDHEIAVKRMGYETRREKITATPSSPPDLNPVLVPKTRRGALKRSAMLPGSGQWYSEYRAKGTLITLAQIATVASAVGGILNAGHARAKYDDAYNAYKSALTVTAIEAARADMDAKYDKLSSAENLRLALVGAAAAVYVYNLIDAAIFEPKIEVKPPKMSMRVEPSAGREGMKVTAVVRF